MKNVANWSGLCEKEACLTSAQNFSKFRYFKFNRVLGETDGVITTSCLTRTAVSDQWIPMGEATGHKRVNSFIKFAPDLRKTPPLKITCPEGKGKLTECISAAEGRIASPEKINILLELSLIHI